MLLLWESLNYFFYTIKIFRLVLWIFWFFVKYVSSFFFLYGPVGLPSIIFEFFFQYFDIFFREVSRLLEVRNELRISTIKFHAIQHGDVIFPWNQCCHEEKYEKVISNLNDFYIMKITTKGPSPKFDWIFGGNFIATEKNQCCRVKNYKNYSKHWKRTSNIVITKN